MRKLLIAMTLALASASCAMTMPIPAYDDIRIGQYRRDAEQVGLAIERALVSRNWVVTARRPGELDATLVGPAFRADITIPYSQSRYSLRYRDSHGLDYDGANIHRHYNNWMNNLRISIERELLAAPPMARATSPATTPQPDQPQGTAQ
jgi:hypothetical protein